MTAARPGDFLPVERARPSVAETEASRAIQSDDEIVSLTELQLIDRIERLRLQRNAVILAHNYQIPAIQDLADFVGDSLELSQQAALREEPVIVFCGVHFMAETAAVLCPQKRVLIPDPEAGCSLAASVDIDGLRRWKAEHPGATVVAYLNTDAETKSETDVCCTSANAVAVVESIPRDREILFLPDVHLGRYVERVTGRELRLWHGACHVHAGIGVDDVLRRMGAFPDSDLLLHPECGCVSNCMEMRSAGELPEDRTFILGTGGMVRHASTCGRDLDLVGTETGMLHRLRKQRPDKRWLPLKEDAVCEYMKSITLQKLYRSLRDDVYEVSVPADIASKAKGAIEAMLATA